jgi:hypothetical protein
MGAGAAIIFVPKSNSHSPSAGGAAASVAATSAAVFPASAAPSGSAVKAPDSAAGGPGAYRTVEDLCAVTDVTTLTELYPSGSNPRHRGVDSGTVYAMHCDMTLSSPTVTGDLRVEVDILRDGSGQSMYAGLKQSNLQRGIAEFDIAGLGSGAYWYVDPTLGTQLSAYDGNLYINVAWGDRADPLKTVPDIATRLTALCRGTITRLRT